MKKFNRAFSLVELIIVIVIISVIMLIGTVAYAGIKEHAQVRADKATAAQIGKALTVRENDVPKDKGVPLYPVITKYDDLVGVENYVAKEIKPQSMKDGDFYVTAFQTKKGKKIVVGVGRYGDEFSDKKYKKSKKPGWAWCEDGEISDFIEENKELIKGEETWNGAPPHEDSDTNVTVTFFANGGSGSMLPQTLTSGLPNTLNSNVFIAPSGYTFKEWNTTSTRTGISYSDGQSVTLLNNLELYAQWYCAGSGTCNIDNYCVEGTKTKCSICKDVGTTSCGSDDVVVTSGQYCGKCSKGDTLTRYKCQVCSFYEEYCSFCEEWHYRDSHDGEVVACTSNSYSISKDRCNDCMQPINCYIIATCDDCGAVDKYCSSRGCNSYASGPSFNHGNVNKTGGKMDCTNSKCNNGQVPCSMPGTINLTPRPSCSKAGCTGTMRSYNQCKGCGSVKWGACVTCNTGAIGMTHTTEPCGTCGGDGKIECDNCSNGWIYSSCKHGEDSSHYYCDDYSAHRKISDTSSSHTVNCSHAQMLPHYST